MCHIDPGPSSAVTITMVPLLLLLATLSTVTPHGFLYDPPARNAMWRFGFTNPVNYNDNELYCGGFSVQWSNNGGKCGVCGDNWADNKPRPHEVTGTYCISPHQNAPQKIKLSSPHKKVFLLM